MKKRPLVLALILFVSLLAPLLHTQKTAAAFNKHLLIDDVVFSDTTGMSANQINQFLNGFPSSCISPNSGFQAREPSGYSPGGGFTYGNYTSAGQVLWRAAVTYGINPRVLLVTLQKEQSLVTGGSSICNSPGERRYTGAMGYGCPDSGTTHNYSGISLYRRNGVTRTVTTGTCVNTAAKAGFSQQVIRAAWLLKFGQQRSRGNVDWAVVHGNWNNSDDPPTCYSGPMTEGTHKRCQNGSATFYDGYVTIDGGATHMDTGATATLYWYTPHIHGNQNFVTLFSSWFGSTISANYYACRNGANIGGQGAGPAVVPNRYYSGPNRVELLSLTLRNNTGSQCLEVHTWNPGYGSWHVNTATNHPAINPEDGEIVASNLIGDNKDELTFAKYASTGSGRIEIHTWRPGYQQWTSQTATNLPISEGANGKVVAFDGGLLFVKYANTSSDRIEIHTWRPGYQQWSSQIATNLSTAEGANGKIIATRGGLIFVKYSNTGSGRIEIHTWRPGFQQWSSQIATNLSTAEGVNGKVIAADGGLLFVKHANTGSGRIEIHTWRPGFTRWLSNIPTNAGAIAN